MKSNVAERVKEQVEHLKGTYEKGKESALELTQSAAAGSRHAAYRADAWVHDNSWKLLGITIFAGLLLGLLLNAREHHPRLERVPR